MPSARPACARRSNTPAVGFGLLISALAVVSKVLGRGAPALWLGFNRLGATRIGIGMLPRGMAPILLVPLFRSRASGLNA